MTLAASFILFRGFNTTNAVNTISLLCGFLVIFSGVYLLNVSRVDPNGHLLLNVNGGEGIPMDNGMAVIPARRSLQAHRNSVGAAGTRRSSAMHRQDASLMATYEEESLGLTRLDNERSSEESLFSDEHQDMKQA